MINLEDQMAERILASNAKRLTAILEEIDSLEKEQAEINRMNKAIKIQLAATKVKVEPQQIVAEDRNGYHLNWTIEKKIDFVLKAATSASNAKWIVEEVMKHEPASTDRTKMMRGISSVLSTK